MAARYSKTMVIAMAAVATFALGGCAGVPVDRGWADVQQEVKGRGGPDVPDAGGTPPAAIDAILRQGPLSAGDAVRVALLGNPRLRAEYARLGLSAADVYQAARPGNPVLNGAVLFSDTPGNADRYDFGITQNFLDLLLLGPRKRLAQAEFARTRQQAAAAILDLSADVRGAYYRLVAARQVQQMRQLVADAATASTRLAQRYADAGNLPALELELSQAEAVQAGFDAQQARSQALAARAELGRLLGLPAERADWQVPDRLPVPLQGEDDAIGLQQLAQSSRLDLQAKQREVDTLAQALGVTRDYRLVGDFEVGVQGERDTDRSHLLGPSASLRLPLFDQGQAAVLRAQARLEQGQAELAGLALDVDQGVALARERELAAGALARSYAAEFIPLRERIVRHTQEKANFMLIGPFELIRARQQEYEAYAGYLEAVRDYWLARVELSRQVGARLPSDGRISGDTVAPDVPPDIPGPAAAGGTP